MLQVRMVGEDSVTPTFVELDYIDLRNHWEWRYVTTLDDRYHVSEEVFQSSLDTKFPQSSDQPMWKVVTIWFPTSERLEVIFAWNHPIADGIGGAAFHTSFLNHLNGPQSGVTTATTEDHILQLPRERLDLPPTQDELGGHALSIKFAVAELWKELTPSSLSNTAATWGTDQIWRPQISRQYDQPERQCSSERPHSMQDAQHYTHRTSSQPCSLLSMFAARTVSDARVCGTDHVEHASVRSLGTIANGDRVESDDVQCVLDHVP
jgi:hypothetical protein